MPTSWSPRAGPNHEQHLELVAVAHRARAPRSAASPVRAAIRRGFRSRRSCPPSRSSRKELDEARLYRVEVPERDLRAARGRCLCRSARSVAARRVRGRRPASRSSRRLEHDSDVVVAGRAQLAVEAQGLVGGRSSPPCRSGRSCAVPRRRAERRPSKLWRQRSYPSFSPSAVGLTLMFDWSRPRSKASIAAR